MKALALIAAGLFLTLSAGAQLPQPFQAKAEALKDFADKNVGRKAIQAGDRDGDGFLSKEEADSLTVLNLTPYRIDIFEVTIRRVVNKDDPNSIWYE